MKDAYSFDIDEASARKSYQRMFVAYLRTFNRMGLTAIPMRAETGPIGGDLSHEFVILATTGESRVYMHRGLLGKPIPRADTDFDGDLSGIIDDWTSLYAATDDIHEEAAFAAIGEEDRIEARGVEVGHIFYFGTKYSAAMGATVATPEGPDVPVHMGSYGVGVSRLVGAIIEASHDEAGIVWPDAVAPWDVGVINLKPGDAATDAMTERVEKQLAAAGLDVLTDDLDRRPGEKFAAMDLIGLPWQVIVGPRGAADGTVEVKRRKTGGREAAAEDAVASRLAEGA